MHIGKIFSVQKDFFSADQKSRPKKQTKNPFCSASRDAFSRPSPIVQIPATHSSTLDRDWQTVSGGLSTCTFNEFVDTDENLITAHLREIRDISPETNGAEEDEEEDNADEEDAAKVPTTGTVALEALENLRHYFQFNSGSEGTFSRLVELEMTIFENSRELKQSSNVNYFVRD
ncbi:hypothetical protein AVEN_263479-1 [Araneus ventricosus]|uniref:Uncharacterized protein n=1 Tax=Araneus ventricosus TaxID=182803 RepID=A0A4Y2EUT3_ARAVE|nr:hypothetical protein AVEN_263479-1 [Araneus ventricosus]